MSYESLFHSNHSKPLASSQEWDTLNRIKNSRFAINGKRNYEAYNDLPAEDSTNAANSAAAGKPQAQTYSMGTNGVFNQVTNVSFIILKLDQQNFLLT